MRDLGRRVLGASAILFGIVAVSWHDFDTWEQLHRLWMLPGGHVLVSILGVAEIAGGIALFFGRTARAGAVLLGVIYAFFATLWIPHVVAAPRDYDNVGNFFEQFSIATGAFLVFLQRSGDAPWVGRAAVAGRVLFGICVVSFTLEQLFYLRGTAHFVPAWLPPNQMFWAVLTTAAFALGAVALLTGVLATLAARLVTAMIVVFGLLIWIPTLFRTYSDHSNFGANAENFAIAGAAWVLADLLARAPSERQRTNGG